MARPRKNKDEFAELPEEWRNAVAGMNKQEIDIRIAEVAKAEEENQKSKKEDQDLKEKKEQVKEANAGYDEASKANRLKIRFAMRVLKDKGLK